MWIGEGTTILNLEPVLLENDVALAHEVYIAAASHDVTDPNFRYANAPVTIRSGAWLATRAFIGPGVIVGNGAVVAACSVVVRDVDPFRIVAGSPARVVGERKIR